MKPIRFYSGCSKKKAYAVLYAGLILLLLILVACNICIGSVNIPLSEVVSILGGKEAGETVKNIILQIRFPRALAAVILGGALALSGYLLQTFFHNPLAGPFVLGISSGAKLVVALVMVFFLGNALKISSFALILAAFAVMIGYICSAVTDFVVTFADDSDIVNLHNWSMGSFSGISWGNIRVMSVVVLLTGAVTFFLSKPMGAYQLGESYAKNMGVNIRLFRVLLVLLSSILSACVTAFAGPVSFVGIAVPQLIKNLFRTAKPILMIPACFLGGGICCLFCDLIARTLFAPTELSISTVTAVFGAPVVIFVMIRQKREVR